LANGFSIKRILNLITGLDGAHSVPSEFAVSETRRPVASQIADGIDPLDEARTEADGLASRLRNLEKSLQRLEEVQDSDKRKLLTGVIEEVMDNLDRGLQDMVPDPSHAGGEHAKWIKRLVLTRNLVLKVLARAEVVPIDHKFEMPGMHTVDSVVKRDDVPDGTIVKTILRGYLWKGQILRKAVVVVAENTDKDGAKDVTDTATNS
jgi:molecular chaperone GrpE (heat shock protein)